ncbi:MAG: helix-turn-helix domain-containing protein [Vicinamibacteraceae bacterium]
MVSTNRETHADGTRGHGRQGLRTGPRGLREERGFTRLLLAHLAGMDPDYLRRVESGDCAPSLRALDALARALGISLSALFARVEASGAPEPAPSALDASTRDP